MRRFCCGFWDGFARVYIDWRLVALSRGYRAGLACGRAAGSLPVLFILTGGLVLWLWIR